MSPTPQVKLLFIQKSRSWKWIWGEKGLKLHYRYLIFQLGGPFDFADTKDPHNTNLEQWLWIRIKLQSGCLSSMGMRPGPGPGELHIQSK